MAINPSTNPTMAGRTTAPGANYPYGSSKDETAPGAGDGTPYFKGRADDIFGFQQALLNATSIVPSGNAETVVASQYLEAIVALASGLADTVTDSGAADAYVLSLPAEVLPPPALFNGLTVSFFASADSLTTAPTADLFGLGAKTIVREDGSALSAGDITTTVMTTVKYNLAGDELLLVRGAGTLAAGGGGLIRYEVFTSSGVYNKNPDATSIKLTVLGAGGGGGGSPNNNNAGAGGGAGGAAIRYLDNSAVSATKNITVGTGGSGGVSGADGTAGGTSSFGGFATATGGGGGDGNGGSGGLAGFGSGGDLNLSGQDGMSTHDGGAQEEGPSGGASVLGGGGAGTLGNGRNSGNYGGGGGGAGANNGSTAAGGAGSNGVVIIEEYA